MSASQPLQSLGFEQIVLNTLKSLTIPPGAVQASMQAEKKNVRWRDDGEVPTDEIGMLFIVDQIQTFTGSLHNFKAIGAEDGAILNVTYYG